MIATVTGKVSDIHIFYIIDYFRKTLNSAKYYKRCSHDILDMPHPCGQFPSTLPSTPERMPTTMNLAPPHLHQPFLMVLKIQIQGLQQLISMANVQEPTLEPLLLHQKLQEYLPSPLKLSKSCYIYKKCKNCYRILFTSY